METSQLAKEWKEKGYVPEMNVYRFLPDATRIIALRECIFKTIAEKPCDDADRAQCPIFTPGERARKSAFELRMREMKDGRKMFRTKSGSLGMGPKSVMEGDEVWVLPGAKVPFVLRSFEGGREPKRYTFIGEAYVHGYMNGEAVREGRKFEVFGLV
jgi:hypothetical protein